MHGSLGRGSWYGMEELTRWENDDWSFYRVTSGIVWRCRADEPVFAAVMMSDMALEAIKSPAKASDLIMCH